MDYLKDIVTLLKPQLQALGFKKSGLNWYNEGKDTVKIFNIQKSAFGKQIYLNVGIKLKIRGKKTSLAYPGCEFGTRLDHLIDAKVLDFENSMKLAARGTAFTHLITSNPFSFFSLADDKGAIKEFVIASKSENQITLKGREYIGIKTP